MISDRQQAYLDAMGIGVWSLRESPSGAVADIGSATGLKLGSGSGGILLVCAADVDSASRLANDISRVLGSVPVWAWPFDDDDAVELAKAIEEKLFTTVAIFGRELAGRFFGGEIPAGLNSASVMLLPAMQDIEHDPDAKRILWSTFCKSGMVRRN